MTLLSIFRWIAALVGLISLSAQGADIKLYPTGPTEDSAFVRFVDGSGEGLRVTAGGSQAVLELTDDLRATAYMPVAGNTAISGELAQGDQKQMVAAKIQPGEFVTVLGLKVDQSLEVQTLHEEADGFTSVRASIAFYNLNSDCVDAGIQAAGRAVFLFEHVLVRDWVRRQVNPVPLSVQLVCGGQVVGQALDLGTLQAGERHSLFLVPGDPDKGFFHVKDTVAQ